MGENLSVPVPRSLRSLRHLSASSALDQHPTQSPRRRTLRTRRIRTFLLHRETVLSAIVSTALSKPSTTHVGRSVANASQPVRPGSTDGPLEQRREPQWAAQCGLRVCAKKGRLVGSGTGQRKAVGIEIRLPTAYCYCKLNRNYVPVSQLVIYSSISGVSSSIFTPIARSLREAIS